MPRGKKPYKKSRRSLGRASYVKRMLREAAEQAVQLPMSPDSLHCKFSSRPCLYLAS